MPPARPVLQKHGRPAEGVLKGKIFDWSDDPSFHLFRTHPRSIAAKRPYGRRHSPRRQYEERKLAELQEQLAAARGGREERSLNRRQEEQNRLPEELLKKLFPVTRK